MDKQLLLWINQDGSHAALDLLFSWLSQYAAFSLPLLLIILGLFAQRFGKDGVKLWLLTISVIVLGDQLGVVLKHFSAQPRPCAELAALVRVPDTMFRIACSHGLNGMPSNHALNFFACSAFLGIILRSWRWTLILGGIAALVALSRIYVGVHYPSQVAAGILIGSIYGLLAAQGALKYAPFVRSINRRTQNPL